MPVCFQLTRVGRTAPTTLVQVDEDICAFFGVEPHPRDWHMGWVDWLGFGLAVGRSFDQIAEDLDTESDWGKNALRLVRFVQANYTSDSWRESKYA